MSAPSVMASCTLLYFASRQILIFIRPQEGEVNSNATSRPTQVTSKPASVLPSPSRSILPRWSPETRAGGPGLPAPGVPGPNPGWRRHVGALTIKRKTQLLRWWREIQLRARSRSSASPFVKILFELKGNRCW